MIRVSVNAKNTFAKLDAYVLKVDEATQEGLNYGAEYFTKVARPPVDLGNLKQSYVIASKNPIGILSNNARLFAGPTRKKEDLARLYADFSEKSSFYQGMVDRTKQPTVLLAYTAYYSIWQGDLWFRSEIGNTTKQTETLVSGLVRKIK